jgi:hypothetical protein
MNQFFFVSMKEPRLECSITELLYVREFFSQKKVYEKKNLDVSLWLTVNRPVVLLLPAYSYLAGDLVMSASILSAGQGLSMGTCRLLKQINTKAELISTMTCHAFLFILISNGTNVHHEVLS